MQKEASLWLAYRCEGIFEVTGKAVQNMEQAVLLRVAAVHCYRRRKAVRQFESGEWLGTEFAYEIISPIED